MAKQGTKPPRQAEAIEAYASRRRGANYQDAYRAAKRRLRNLSGEFAQAPSSYRSFILVGICTALECHLKYFYGHATERYAGHPEILSKLLKDVTVDISTMISVSTSHFQLSDVVAASVSASSLETYLAKASDFLAVMHRVDKHNFPWDYQKIFTETDREMGKDIALRLDRLREVFVLRHRLVHETDVIDPNLAFARAAVDAQDIANDALWLMDQFEQIYWQSEVSPELNPKIDVPMPEHVEDIEAEIDQVFQSIEEHVDERQRDDFQNFKSSFKDYLVKRAEFMASPFVAFKSEQAMSNYVVLGGQYLSVLSRIYLEHQFLKAKYPVSRQEAELLGEVKLDSDDE